MNTKRRNNKDITNTPKRGKKWATKIRIEAKIWGKGAIPRPHVTIFYFFPRPPFGGKKSISQNENIFSFREVTGEKKNRKI